MSKALELFRSARIHQQLATEYFLKAEKLLEKEIGSGVPISTRKGVNEEAIAIGIGKLRKNIKPNTNLKLAGYAKRN